MLPTIPNNRELTDFAPTPLNIYPVPAEVTGTIIPAGIMLATIAVIIDIKYSNGFPPLAVTKDAVCTTNINETIILKIGYKNASTNKDLNHILKKLFWLSLKIPDKIANGEIVTSKAIKTLRIMTTMNTKITQAATTAITVVKTFTSDMFLRFLFANR